MRLRGAPRLLAVILVAGSVIGTAAFAADVTEIALAIHEHRFSPDEIRVKAGAPFVLVITNHDGSVEEFESHDLRIEKIIPAGKVVRLRMPALKPGTYRFIGEYHASSATGRIVAE